MGEGLRKIARPMEKASALFSEKALAKGVSPDEPRFRKPFIIFCCRRQAAIVTGGRRHLAD